MGKTTATNNIKNYGKIEIANETNLLGWLNKFESIGNGLNEIFKVVTNNPNAGISFNQYNKIKNIGKTS